jgi:hypothetical protein
VFQAGMGADVVKDFEDGIDKIKLAGFVFADLTITAAGGNVNVSVVGGESMIIENIAVADITAADFI